MLIAVLLAAGLVVGVPSWVVGVGVVAALQPMFGLVALAMAIFISLRSRFAIARPRSSLETTFFNAMAAELRAGASLRTALGSAAARVPDLGLAGAGRRAAAGVPAPTIAAELALHLPGNGRLVAAGFELAANTGARAADVFETLAQRSAARDELDRERRTLTAQARLSALVVGGLPVALLLGMLATGRAQDLLDAGAVGWVIVGIGGGLELAGLGVVALMLWRAAK